MKSMLSILFLISGSALASPQVTVCSSTAVATPVNVCIEWHFQQGSVEVFGEKVEFRLRFEDMGIVSPFQLAHGETGTVTLSEDEQGLVRIEGHEDIALVCSRTKPGICR